MVAVSGEELTPQIDFSGGQINLSARRREDLPAVKAGGRTVLNWRTNNTGQLEYRPGRRALFLSGSARTEYIRVSTSEEFMLAFPDGGIAIYNLAGALVASNYSSAYKWSASAGVNLVSWAPAQDSIYVAYPAMRPQVVKWDRGSRTWGFSAFAFDSSGNTIKQPYYRLSVPGASIAYSAVSGSVTLTCDEDYFTSGMIGTTLSIVGQQVTITAVTDARHATATPSYRLPDTIAIQVQDTTPFQVGQIVEATTQNIKIEVGYLRTMLPDIELTKRFGDVDMTSVIKSIREEYNAKIAALGTGAAAEKAAKKLHDAAEADIRDVAAMRDRLRNVYGWTNDATGRQAHNIARDLRNWTSLASLGGAAVNSFTDFGMQAVFRYGLTNTFREQWAPFVKSLMGASGVAGMARREAREMGIGVETALGLARHNFSDVVENYKPGNKFSRGVACAGGDAQDQRRPQRTRRSRVVSRRRQARARQISLRAVMKKFATYCLAAVGAAAALLVALSLLAGWAQDHGYNPFM